MKQFTPLLERINDRLNLPQPTKSRILLEISADLEDLYRFYIGQGLSDNEAKQKSEEKIDLTDEALAELVNIHQTFFRRLMDKIGEQAQTQWERIILVFVFLIIVTLGGQSVISTRFFKQASLFVFPVLGIFFTVFLLSLHKFYFLYIKKDHQLDKLRNGLNAILFLGIMNLSIGVFGYIKELYSAGIQGLFFVSYLGFLITSYGPEASNELMLITQWMMKSSSLVMLCILVAIFTAMVWFILLNKVSIIEQAEASYLLKD